MSSSSSSSKSRVVGHIDMDCFYCQVERVRDPTLLGKPMAVVQYNPFGDLKTLRPEDNRVVTSGSIIAVSYEARAQGVKRSMRGAEAKKVCPDIILVQVPTAHGKADLTIYRESGDRVVKLIQSISPKITLEKASIDEVYLDITNEVTAIMSKVQDDDDMPSNANSNVPTYSSEINIIKDLSTYSQIIQEASVSSTAGEDESELHMAKSQLRNGHAGQTIISSSIPDNLASATEHSSSSDMSKNYQFQNFKYLPYDNQLLICGAAIIAKFRSAVYSKLGFTCSAGIAHNKMLAKLASSMHKPNKQTIVPSQKVIQILDKIPISRVQGFGGNFGELLSKEPFNIKTFFDLKNNLNKMQFIQYFDEETYNRVIASANGVDNDEVKSRSIGMSLACGKSFRYSNAIHAVSGLKDGTLDRWLNELSLELYERINSDTMANNRKPKLLTVHVSFSRMSGMMLSEESPLSAAAVPSAVPVSLTHTSSSSSSRDSVDRSELHPAANETSEDRYDGYDKDKIIQQQLQLQQHQAQPPPQPHHHGKPSNASSTSFSRSAPLVNTPSLFTATAAAIIRKIVASTNINNRLSTTTTTTTTTTTITPIVTTSSLSTPPPPPAAAAASSSSSSSSTSLLPQPPTHTQSQPPLYITYLALTASNFEDVAPAGDSISSYFTKQQSQSQSRKPCQSSGSDSDNHHHHSHSHHQPLKQQQQQQQQQIQSQSIKVMMKCPPLPQEKISIHETAAAAASGGGGNAAGTDSRTSSIQSIVGNAPQATAQDFKLKRKLQPSIVLPPSSSSSSSSSMHNFFVDRTSVHTKCTRNNIDSSDGTSGNGISNGSANGISNGGGGSGGGLSEHERERDLHLISRNDNKAEIKLLVNHSHSVYIIADTDTDTDAATADKADTHTDRDRDSDRDGTSDTGGDIGYRAAHPIIVLDDDDDDDGDVNNSNNNNSNNNNNNNNNSNNSNNNNSNNNNNNNSNNTADITLPPSADLLRGATGTGTGGDGTGTGTAIPLSAAATTTAVDDSSGIDMTVFNSLPLHIQNEITSQINQQQKIKSILARKPYNNDNSQEKRTKKSKSTVDLLNNKTAAGVSKLRSYFSKSSNSTSTSNSTK